MEKQANNTYTHSSNAFGLTIHTFVRYGNWNIKKGEQFTFTCSFLGDGSITVGSPVIGTGLQEMTFHQVSILLPRALNARTMRGVLFDICLNIYAKRTMQQVGEGVPWETMDLMTCGRIAVEYGASIAGVQCLWRLLDSLPQTRHLCLPFLTNGPKLSVLAIDCNR